CWLSRWETFHFSEVPLPPARGVPRALGAARAPDRGLGLRESSCFANNPTKEIGDGLGELEIKPESLRYIVCSTRELLEDSSVNIETWLMDKARRAFAFQINEAILVGDGFGKPMGILNPQAGIPIAETGSGTPAGQFSWQDLGMPPSSWPMSLQASPPHFLHPPT